MESSRLYFCVAKTHSFSSFRRKPAQASRRQGVATPTPSDPASLRQVNRRTLSEVRRTCVVSFDPLSAASVLLPHMWTSQQLSSSAFFTWISSGGGSTTAPLRILRCLTYRHVEACKCRFWRSSHPFLLNILRFSKTVLPMTLPTSIGVGLWPWWIFLGTPKD